MSNRRHFLKTSLAATSSLLATGAPALIASNSSPQKTLKVGLVGCGGRGTGAAEQALMADPNTQLWAVADVFHDSIRSTLTELTNLGQRAAVPIQRQFTGLDGYKQLLDSGVDVVLLATPPVFRPDHIAAAVDKGVHIFSEKPCAVDMPGVRSVLKSTALAKKKNLSLQHGFCWRFDPGMKEAYKKLHAKEVGEIRNIYGTFFTFPPNPFPEEGKPATMSDVEWQIRWWQNFNWLSGGPLVEQAVHTVDQFIWAMNGALPIAAVGTGGRAQRTDAGNVYDHYNVTYEFPGKVFCQITSRQYRNSYGEIKTRVSCQEGTVELPYRPKIRDINGKTLWRHRPEKRTNKYQLCHDEFFQALRAGKTINTGELLANSTAIGIMGSIAAHTGKRIKWEDFQNDTHAHLPKDLKLDGAKPIAPIPTPG